jgi:hypothetical protein
MTSGTALLTATAVHLGFQATVTAVAYPALARVPAARWSVAHRFHSRAIAPVVAVIYAAVVLAAGWTLLTDPDAWALVAAAASAVAVLVTAVAAAPSHRRLGAGHDPERISRLLHVDRVRAAATAVAFAAALLSAG